jgi:DNA-binding transcriptional LysR family regulator
MDIELRHLRYFVAVAEEASFTGAARRLHLAQQALSAQIQQLEQRVGAPLFVRTTRRVELTETGEVLLDAARPVLAGADDALARARQSARHDVKQLHVGINVTAVGEVATALLSAYQARRPEVDVELRTFDLRAPAAGLLDRSSDVAILRPPIEAPGVEMEAIASEPRVFVLPADHRWASKSALSLDDVAGESWIACQPATDGCDPMAWRDNWLAPGRARPAVGAVASTLDEWREHTAAGHGLSLCPASAERYYARPELAFVPAVDAPPAVVAVAWRNDTRSALTSEFVDTARDLSKEWPSKDVAP